MKSALGRRDTGLDQAESVAVFLDTYLDRRTASGFGVSAAGVRSDAYYPTDDFRGELGFDPAWVDARTSRSISLTRMGRGAVDSVLASFGSPIVSPQVWGATKTSWARRWIPSRERGSRSTGRWCRGRSRAGRPVSAICTASTGSRRVAAWSCCRTSRARRRWSATPIHATRSRPARTSRDVSGWTRRWVSAPT